MAYATYEQYKNLYIGNAVPEADFPRLAERASEYIDFVTFNRLRDASNLITDDVVKCTCAIAEISYSYEQASGEAGGDMLKTSEKVGEYSVTYAQAVDSNGHAMNLDSKKEAIARQYIGHTGLMYRGW